MMRLKLTILAILVILFPLAARADTSKLLKDVLAKTDGALVMVTATIENEIDSQSVANPGICIDSSGVFITLAFGSYVRPETVKDIKLIVPGVEGKTVKGKLLAVDPSGIGFIQATEPHAWKAIRFADKADLSVGMQVVSVGLLSEEMAYQPYLGTGYVGAIVRVPEPLAHITGGRLTSVGSPVFTADGRAVGIVGRQLYMAYQMITGRGPLSLKMSGRHETAYFLPSDEFSYVFSKIPKPGQSRRLPWIGILRFDGVEKSFADMRGLDRPGVMIDQVVSGGVADKAGLKDRDIIIAMDGQGMEQLATVDLTGRNFIRKLMRIPVGKQITLMVVSGKEEKNVTLTVGEMPTRPGEAKRYSHDGLGMIVREKVMLDKYIGKSAAADVPGMIVVYVKTDGPADVAGLKVSDVITNVNQQDVRTVDGFKQILEGALTGNPDAAINFVIHRGDQPLSINVQPPR